MQSNQNKFKQTTSNTAEKYSRNSALQDFPKPTVILQHLQLKTGKLWRCSYNLGSNSIQLSRQGGEKKHGQEKQTRLSTYNLLGDAADDPIPKIPLNLKIIHCPHNWRALKFPLRRIPKLAPVLLLPQIFSTPENSSDFFTVTQLE